MIKTEHKLIEFLEKYDVVDLLEKIVVFRFYSCTDVIDFTDCKLNRGMILYELDSLFPLIMGYLMCHKVEIGKEKIDYLNLENIILKSLDNKLQERLNHVHEDFDIGNIDFNQHNLSDILNSFSHLPFIHILSCQDDLLKSKYNVTANDLYDDFVVNHDNALGNIVIDKPITPNEFIDNIDKYIDRNFFVVNKESKTFDIAKDLSFKIGDFDSEGFTIGNPLSFINLKRKLFLQVGDNVYNFSSKLLLSRINRCVEKLFENDEQNQLWRVNLTVRTETLCEKILTTFSKQGKYYKNNYYYIGKNRHENDGLFIFGNFILIIESKATKFNPDPIEDNYEKVVESYKKVIQKANEQANNIKNEIIKNKSITLYDENNNIKLKIDDIEDMQILTMCVYFEDIGTILAGNNVFETNSFNVTYFDLVLIFAFIENPILILKYIEQRNKAVDYNKILFTDELTYLGRFLEDFNFITTFNDFAKQEGIPLNANIFVDPSDFGNNLELYFLTGENKPEIKINGLVQTLINLDNESVFDKYLSLGLFNIISFSSETIKRIEASFKKGSNGGKRIPQVIRFKTYGEKEFCIMVIKKHHNAYEYKETLGYVKKYFIEHPDLSFLYLGEVNKGTVIYKRYSESDVRSIDNDCINLIKNKSLIFKTSILYKEQNND